MQSILLLEDDSILQEVYRQILKPHYRILIASHYSEAVQIAQKTKVDAALIDLHLNDSVHTGYDFLLWFKLHHPEKPTLIQSGSKEIPLVVKCLQAGAEDYLEKPVEGSALLLRLERLFKLSHDKKIYLRGFEKLEQQNSLIGISSAIQKLKEKIEKAKGLRIIFTGETGSGKTPSAYYSHLTMAKLEGKPRPFEQVNCAGLNGDNFDDLLFGHRKGAFTGALTDKKGLVEIAKGGDLFLDEISELSLESQSKFLTFLDSLEYYRLGDDLKQKTNLRILTATNVDLREKIKRGEFRQDLFSRLSQVEIFVPPLRDRREDIPLLLDFFIKKFAGYAKPYDLGLLKHFIQARWTEGNIRELRDAVEYCCLVSKGEEKITLEHLPEKKQEAPTVALPYFLETSIDEHLATVEKSILQQHLEKHSTVDALTHSLQISKATLYRKLKKYGLKIEETQVQEVS